ncbi:MAG: hypothetical protein AAB468_00890 [Patescibacteria group bacterium]
MEPNNNLADKIAAAQAALTGPERLQKKEQAEKIKGLNQEKSELENRQAQIQKEKEAVEISWINFDDRRKNTRATLAPILEQEKQVEDEEAKLELEEAKTVVPQDRQALEKKRSLVQNRRQEIERQKWEMEETVWKIETAIEDNTKRYRALLDEEDKIVARLQEVAITNGA